MMLVSKERYEEAIAEHVAFRLNPKPWVTANRIKHDLKDMTFGHLENTMQMFKDGRMHQMRPNGCSGLSNAEWLRIFENEMIIRVHTENVPFGKRKLAFHASR